MSEKLPTLNLFRAIRQLEDFRVAREIAKGANLQARDKEGRSALVALAGALSPEKLDMSDEVALEATFAIERQLLAGGAPVQDEVVVDGKHTDPLIMTAFTRCFFAVMDHEFSAESQINRLNGWLNRMDPNTPEIWGKQILDQWNSEMFAIGEDEDLHIEPIAFGVQVADVLLERGVPTAFFHERLDDGGEYYDQVIARVTAFERHAQAMKKTEPTERGQSTRPRARP